VLEEALEFFGFVVAVDVVAAGCCCCKATLSLRFFQAAVTCSLFCLSAAVCFVCFSLTLLLRLDWLLLVILLSEFCLLNVCSRAVGSFGVLKVVVFVHDWSSPAERSRLQSRSSCLRLRVVSSKVSRSSAIEWMEACSTSAMSICCCCCWWCCWVSF
jgi:hypothetical protein